MGTFFAGNAYASRESDNVTRAHKASTLNFTFVSIDDGFIMGTSDIYLERNEQQETPLCFRQG